MKLNKYLIISFLVLVNCMIAIRLLQHSKEPQRENFKQKQGSKETVENAGNAFEGTPLLSNSSDQQTEVWEAEEDLLSSLSNSINKEDLFSQHQELL